MKCGETPISMHDWSRKSQREFGWFVGRGLCLLLIALSTTATAHQIEPKTFPPPEPTSWKPEGCRTVPSDDPALPSRIAWRNLHADEVNTDETEPSSGTCPRASNRPRPSETSSSV